MPEGYDPTDWETRKMFHEMGRPWTRDSYIAWNWAGLEIDEDEWDESELPPDLRRE